MADIDLQNRAPTVIRTPDFRERVERRYDVLNNIPKSPVEILAKCWLPLGTTDEKYTDCYLIEQKVEGQNGNSREPCVDPPVLVRVFEQLDGLNETLIGEPGVVMDQYGRRSVILNYWQLNVGTATYQVPGQTAAPVPFNDCILKTEERTNDGTLRKIQRTYIDSGILDDTQELRFGGKLLLRELTYLNEIPPTPSGWTLVTQSTEFVDGLPVYKYGFANGGGGGGGAGGVISTDIQYNMSPDEGTTGVTVTTIKYISAPSVVVNPITPPGGSVLIRVSYEDEAGYRLWTAVYADGQGTVSSSIETKEGGRLKIYRITAINAAPSTPAATIGGTVTLIDAVTKNGTDAADGTVIYDYTWAEGNGEVSRQTEYRQSIDEGTAGLTLTTIRHLTALSTVVNPITPPASSILVSVSFNNQDGYKLWTATYARGTGTVTTSTEFKNGGNLVIYRIVALGTPPSTPGSTIGGTVTLIQETERTEDGYTLYDYQWAEGKGTISTGTQTKNGGQLIIYSITALGTAPSAPSPTIGGTVTLIDTVVREQDGYQLFDYTWAEGKGEISRDTEYQQSVNGGTDGLTLITIRHLDALSVTSNPITPPGGTILTSEGSTKQDGYRIWTATYAKGTGVVNTEEYSREDGSIVTEVTSLSAAAATPAGPGGGYLVRLQNEVQAGRYRNIATYITPPDTVVYRRQVEFQMPGLAYFSGTDLILQPGALIRSLGEIEVSFDTAQDTTDPFTVEQWGGFIETYTPTDTGIAINNQFGLIGYLCDSNSSSGTGMYKGVDCTAWSYQRFASIPDTPPTGDTIIGVDNVPYLTALDGTMVFKRTVTTITLP